MRRIAAALLLLVGCIDEFKGSNVQIDFSTGMPVQASPYAAAPTANELPSASHFTLYAFERAEDESGNGVGHLYELQRFEIHRLIDLASPCFIDVGSHVPFEGLHVTKYADAVQESGATEVESSTALQRMRNVTALASVSGPKVVTSASTGGYLDYGADCADTNGFPPASCTDADSNRRRLEMCQAAWRRDDALFEGTDRILTAPLNGTTHGMVHGMNPVNLAPIGGSQFFIDESLAKFDGFVIYHQLDSAAADDLGDLFLYGEPETPTRGVLRVRMTSMIEPSVTADMAIFSDIDDDEVHF